MNGPFLLDVLRHGATSLRGGFLGATDLELTPAGRDSMRAACRGRQWSAVHTSPLLRCRSFASELHHAAVVDSGFAEYDFGDWDGRLVQDLLRTDGEAVEAFWRDPAGHPPPGAERHDVFQTRVRHAAELLIGNRADSPGPVLLVSHAGVMRALLELFVGLPPHVCWNVELPHAVRMRLAFDVRDGEILHTRLLRLEAPE